MEGGREGERVTEKRRVVSGQLSVDSFQTGRRGDGETGRWREGVSQFEVLRKGRTLFEGDYHENHIPERSKSTLQ